MNRKIVIVVLTLGAVATLALAFAARDISKAEGWVWCSDYRWGGQIILCRGNVAVFMYPPPGPDAESYLCYTFRTSWARSLELPLFEWNPPNETGWSSITVTLWFPLVLLGAYPTIAFIRGPLRRYRRRRRGLCLTCGYDLRGSAGRCPECVGEP